MQFEVDVLGDGRVFFGASTAEVIEVDVEPVVNAFVELGVLVANLLGGGFLLEGFNFGRGSVFVGAANLFFRSFRGT